MFAQMAAESAHGAVAEGPPLSHASSLESSSEPTSWFAGAQQLAKDSQAPSSTADDQQQSEQQQTTFASSGDDVVFETDPRSRKARVKNSEALMALCSAHNKTLDRSNLRVCEGRKVVYLLAEGDISHPCCFLKESPTPSHRSKSTAPSWTPPKGVTWNSVMIPDGWKVGVVVDGDPWTAETKVIDGCIKYRFTFVDQQGREVDSKRSEWCETPGAAFKSLFCRVHPDKDVGRHNGKLYIGCHYDSVQDHLRNFFKRKMDAGAYDGESKVQIKTLLDQWINNLPLDVVTRKPLKRFSNSRGPSVQGNQKRTKRSSGEIGLNPPKPQESDISLAELISSFTENDLYHLPDLEDLEDPMDLEDPSLAQTRSVAPSPDISVTRMPSLRENGAKAASKGPSVVNNTQDLEKALRFIVGAHPNDPFRIDEIFSLIRLQVFSGGTLVQRDNVRKEGIRTIVSRAVQPGSKLEEAKDESREACRMSDYFRMQVVHESVLLKTILSMTKSSDRLSGLMSKVKGIYEDFLGGQEIDKDLEESISAECRKALEGQDLDAIFKLDLMEDLPADSLQEFAVKEFSKLVLRVFGVPPGLDLPVLPGKSLMGTKTVWDKVSHLLQRLLVDARAGLGLFFPFIS